MVTVDTQRDCYCQLILRYQAATDRSSRRDEVTIIQEVKKRVTAIIFKGFLRAGGILHTLSLSSAIPCIQRNSPSNRSGRTPCHSAYESKSTIFVMLRFHHVVNRSIERALVSMVTRVRSSSKASMIFNLVRGKRSSRWIHSALRPCLDAVMNPMRNRCRNNSRA